jgi:hypothetical protein
MLEHKKLCLNPRLHCCLAVQYEKLRFNIYYVQQSYFVARYGVDGHPCILRALCEAKECLKPGKSLVEDILHAVFA